MKTWLWRGALVLTLLGMLGGLVMLSGIVPIKASSGHWAITAWLLDFSKQRSVSTHTLGVKPPPLDDPRMVVKGGAYYDIGCRPCHGGPELRQPRIAARMTPHPVYLPPRIANWEAEELFYMIKHGIKFTGMPAWPAPGRDDEVWAIVAFLRRLPILNAAEYARVTRGETADDGMDAPLRALAAKSVAARRAVSENCSRCHGADGMGRDGASPVIAGQQAAYIFATLNAYGRGRRHSGMMEPIAAGLSAQTHERTCAFLRRACAHFAIRQSQAPPSRAGVTIALGGVAQNKVPPCAECHGPGARRRNPFYPDLAGQHGDYLVLQLQLFKAGKRGGTAYAHLMQHVAPHLSEGQMRDVAAYYSVGNRQIRNQKT